MGGMPEDKRLNTPVEERERMEERYSGTGWRRQLPRAPKGGGKRREGGGGCSREGRLSKAGSENSGLTDPCPGHQRAMGSGKQANLWEASRREAVSETTALPSSVFGSRVLVSSINDGVLQGTERRQRTDLHLLAFRNPSEKASLPPSHPNAAAVCGWRILSHPGGGYLGEVLLACGG